MKKFRELPKDILVQLLINVNNLNLMSDYELERKQKMIADEIKRRTERTRGDIIKKSLLSLQAVPHLKDFVSENIKIINSIEAISSSSIIIDQISYPFLPNGSFQSDFLKTLSSLIVIPNVYSKSLLVNIYEYAFSGKTYDSHWLSAIKINYNVCEICHKQEYLFQYKYDSSSIILFENNLLCGKQQSKFIESCPICEKLHCIDHICKL
jgi:hypothetical protein